MRIVNLIENTEGHEGCVYAHGLSFYVETSKHKLLLDLGPSEETLHNAEKLGINLSEADTVILSHGHYDHSGGIMPFVKINPDADIYMQETADADYYADDGKKAEGERYRYIGIDKAIADLPQVVKLQGDHRIDDELELFTIKKRSHALPFTNKRLLIKENDEFIRDDFLHEQYLVIRDGNKRILLSGCAHNGMLSILEAFKDKYGSAPDVVISGFHLMKKTKYTDEELREIIDISNELKKYPTRFFTCHCTGEPAYKIMKLTMGEQLQYVHSGEEVDLSKTVVERKKKERSSFMKWHKFFAWATVFCFVMTMITGYKKK
ncbi:MAG: MBL fold metallo-hydrolase [Lachnospiraceae bacterium]|nr:MBL fold metallo-hydrolase [Lachnospiraceae bacterium]